MITAWKSYVSPIYIRQRVSTDVLTILQHHPPHERAHHPRHLRTHPLPHRLPIAPHPHLGWISPLLNVRPPEVRALAPGGDGLGVDALAGDTHVAGEEVGEDGGELGGEVEDGCVCVIWDGC
jgi:hypothetical protein